MYSSAVQVDLIPQMPAASSNLHLSGVDHLPTRSMLGIGESFLLVAHRAVQGGPWPRRGDPSLRLDICSQIHRSTAPDGLLAQSPAISRPHILVIVSLFNRVVAKKLTCNRSCATHHPPSERVCGCKIPTAGGCGGQPSAVRFVVGGATDITHTTAGIWTILVLRFTGFLLPNAGAGITSLSPPIV